MTDGPSPLVPLPDTGTLRLDRTSWHRGEYELRAGDDVVARMDYALSGHAVGETASGRWRLVHPDAVSGVAVIDADSGDAVAVLDYRDWSSGGTARLGDASYSLVVDGVVHPRWRVRREEDALFTVVRPHLLGGDAEIELTEHARRDPRTVLLVLITVHAMISQAKDANRS